MKKIRRRIRSVIRRILFIREKETIYSGIERKKINIQKIFYKTKITKEELQKSFEELGIVAGDKLIVHSSWRQFYNFSGTPEDVIMILKKLLGEDGTLVMPAYGDEKKYFDVNNTPSMAGVLSEVFRKMPRVFRSHCTHFSMCAFGKDAEYLVKDHSKSRYGFDEYSPYFKFIELEKSKILFLGLGKEPTKISLFHCVGAALKKENDYFNNLLSEKYESKIIVDGIKYKKEMITRKKSCLNDNKKFKKIFREIKNKKFKKISNLEIVIFEAKEGFEKAKKFAEEGVYCYK